MGACCKKGYRSQPECGGSGEGNDEYPDEGAATAGVSDNHYCVVDQTQVQKLPPILHEGEGCWSQCWPWVNASDARCDYCGSEGRCCKKGWDHAGVDLVCDKIATDETGHVCVI